ncbi:MAG: hypothetical protein U1A25_00560 [Candidatus Sungbacteria bacterium]|nr:hypothetical protein [bacterium]MDZ4260136.1 hypothetical protein [Candidatus Sungbacteria bacterium]
MKRMIRSMLFAAVGLVVLFSSGCVIVPPRGGYVIVDPPIVISAPRPPVLYIPRLIYQPRVLYYPRRVYRRPVQQIYPCANHLSDCYQTRPHHHHRGYHW